MNGVSLFDSITLQPRATSVRAVSASARCSSAPNASGGVAREVRGRRDRIVRRIEVDEVAAPARRRPRSDSRRGAARRARAPTLRRAQRVGHADRRIGVAPDRHVEGAGAVDAPQAVEAGLVEVDERRRAIGARSTTASRSFHRVARRVVVRLVVRVAVMLERLITRGDVASRRRCRAPIRSALTSASTARSGATRKNSAAPPTNGS